LAHFESHPQVALQNSEEIARQHFSDDTQHYGLQSKDVGWNSMSKQKTAG